jgi:hypothetical protein
MLNGCQAGRKAERTNFHMFDQLRRAAVQESGHAVAALHFWLPVRDVAVEANGTGDTRYARRLGWGEIDRWTVSAFAGPETERDRFGNADEAGDLEVIKTMLRRLDLHWGERELAEHRERARHLVRDQREAIAAVACLTGDNVAALLPIREPEGSLWTT